MDNGCPSDELYEAAKKRPPGEFIRVGEQEQAFAEKVLRDDPAAERVVSDAAAAAHLRRAIAAEEERLGQDAQKAARFFGYLRPEPPERVGPRRRVLEYLRGVSKIPQGVLAEALGITQEALAAVEAGFARLEVVHAQGAAILDRIRENCRKTGDAAGGSLDTLLFGRDELDTELSRMESAEQFLNARILGLANFNPEDGKIYVVCEAVPCPCLRMDEGELVNRLNTVQERLQQGIHYFPGPPEKKPDPRCPRCGGSGRMYEEPWFKVKGGAA